MGSDGNLTPESTNFLMFFTVDSNILLAIGSLILIVFEVMIFLNKREDIPLWAYIVKYIAVCATTLTFLTTVLYLSPLLGKNFWKLFLNNNLFYHLICPVLGIVSLIFFEAKEKMNWKVSFFAVVPMALYSIYYIINVYTHLDNGKVNPRYDFYYFASNGVFIAIIMVIFLLLLTYGSALLLYYLREKRRQKLEQ